MENLHTMYRDKKPQDHRFQIYNPLYENIIPQFTCALNRSHLSA